MADAAAILDRIRSHGANLVLNEAGGLRVVNQTKLPAGAMAFVTQHRGDLANLLRAEAGGDDGFEERAAIIEFEGKAPREWAQQFARILFRRRPPGVEETDWSWFVDTCGRMIDAAPERTP
jgi:hypothetical protein